MTKLEHILKDKGISKKEFSELGGWSYSSVMAWCRGDESRVPTIANALEIESLLGSAITASEIRMIATI